MEAQGSWFREFLELIQQKLSFLAEGSPEQPRFRSPPGWVRT
jgi:hypothetical protein